MIKLTILVAVLLASILTLSSLVNTSKNLDKTSCQVSKSRPTNNPITIYQFETCITLRMALYYKKSNNEFIELSDGSLNKAESKCENAINSPVLKIDFRCGSLAVFFGKAPHGSNTTLIQKISGFYTVGETNYHFTTPQISNFNSSGTSNYYKCSSEQNITLGDSSELVVSNLAFAVHTNLTNLNLINLPESCAIEATDFSLSSAYVGLGGVLLALVGISYFMICRNDSTSTY